MIDFRFLARFFSKRKQIGALFPSSSALAGAMAGAVRSLSPPTSRGITVLEIGAGTGALTQGLTLALGPNDWLTCVEMDPMFARGLRRRMRKWRTQKDRPQLPHLELYEGSVLQFNPLAPYDWIVCGLPLNNFSPEFIEVFARKSAQLLKPNGHFIFFEYEKIRTIKRWFALPKERKRLVQLEALFRRWVLPRRVMTKIVWRNIPPARIHCMRCVERF